MKDDVIIMTSSGHETSFVTWPFDAPLELSYRLPTGNKPVGDMVHSMAWVTRKLCYRKNDRAMRPIHRCPGNFRDSLTTPTATIPNIFTGFCSDRPYECSYNIWSPYLYPFLRWEGVAKLQSPNLEEGEAIRGREWYHAKEHWWVPIGPTYIYSTISPLCPKF